MKQALFAINRAKFLDLQWIGLYDLVGCKVLLRQASMSSLLEEIDWKTYDRTPARIDDPKDLAIFG